MAEIAVTAANVIAGANAVIAEGTAGATITAGQLLYIDTAASNVLKLADANGVSPVCDLAGIALNSASTGQPVKYQTGGLITIGGTVTVGTTYILGATTPGAFAPDSDKASGWKVNQLGIATTTGILLLRIWNTGVTV